MPIRAAVRYRPATHSFASFSKAFLLRSIRLSIIARVSAHVGSDAVLVRVAGFLGVLDADAGRIAVAFCAIGFLVVGLRAAVMAGV